MTNRLADDLDLAGQVQRLLFPKSSPVCDWNCIGVKNRMARSLGVREVEVSFEDKKAHLTAEDAVTDQALEEAVKKAGGYTGKVIERKSEK